jgi:hypothetical protein
VVVPTPVAPEDVTAEAAEATIEQMLTGPPLRLFGVSVRRAMEALKSVPPDTVMKELWTGHAFLEPVRTDAGEKRGKVAVISYRVIPADDGFTLDERAFTCALRSAHTSR